MAGSAGAHWPGFGEFKASEKDADSPKQNKLKQSEWCCTRTHTHMPVHVCSPAHAQTHVRNRPVQHEHEESQVQTSGGGSPRHHGKTRTVFP